MASEALPSPDPDYDDDAPLALVVARPRTTHLGWPRPAQASRIASHRVARILVFPDWRPRFRRLALDVHPARATLAASWGWT